MRQPSRSAATLLSIALLSASCQRQEGESIINEQTVGTAAGVVAGGILGSAIGSGSGQVLAIVGGALLGGALGNMLGTSLNNNDKSAYDTASQYALEHGQTRSWSNPSSGHSGTIMPQSAYTDSSGRLCRHYTQMLTVSGQRYDGHGTACKGSDGIWRPISG